VFKVERNASGKTVGNTSATDVEREVADRAVGTVGEEVDLETETINGGETNDGVGRDIGTKGERENDRLCVVAWLFVGTVVTGYGGEVPVRVETVALSLR
jgi:hypothetical protein